MINIVEPQPFISIVNNSNIYKRIFFLEGYCEKYPQIAYSFVLLVVKKNTSHSSSGSLQLLKLYRNDSSYSLHF